MFGILNLKFSNYNIMLMILSILFMVIKIQSTQNFTSNYTCTTTNPITPDACYNQTTNVGNLCCYIQGLQNYTTDKMCISIPSDSYEGNSLTTYNNSEYSISCKTNNTSTLLASCGSSNAQSKSDCSIRSSTVNSCCYYENISFTYANSTTSSGCYWLGTKYSGNIYWAGINLDCTGNYINYSFYILFILFSLFV